MPSLHSVVCVAGVLLATGWKSNLAHGKALIHHVDRLVVLRVETFIFYIQSASITEAFFFSRYARE